jgi:cytochrome c553
MIKDRIREILIGIIFFVGACPLPANAANGIETKFAICGSCHGKEGQPSDPTVPIIWGQQQAYLEKQLRDYKSGERDSQIMSSLAEAFKREEISDVAAYFSGQRWPDRKDGGKPESVPRAIPSCQTCHDADLLGAIAAGEPAPRIAGQTREYLVETMRSFADGERDNAGAMAALMKGLSANERESIARYLSSL